MPEFINLRKLTAKTLIGLLMVSGLIAQSSNKQAVAANGVQGLELHYQSSAFQCSANGEQANISVYVYNKANKLLKTMSQGDRYLTSDIDSVNDLKFRYKFDNVNCFTRYRNTPDISGRSSGNGWRTYNVAPASMTLGREEALPTLGTYGDRNSISTMLTGLDSYEELYLVKLASKDSSSAYFDLQDVVLVVDNNPVIESFAD